MLAEHNLDINVIPGTGTGGRVTKRDVRQFIEGGGRPRRRGAGTAPAAPPEVHDVPHFSASLEDAIVEPTPAAPPGPPGTTRTRPAPAPPPAPPLRR